jgi:hypothetical protein
LNHAWLKEKSEESFDATVVKNIRHFKATEMLKQASFAYMSSQLVQKQDREDMAKLFK